MEIAADHHSALHRHQVSLQRCASTAVNLSLGPRCPQASLPCIRLCVLEPCPAVGALTKPPNAFLCTSCQPGKQSVHDTRHPPSLLSGLPVSAVIAASDAAARGHIAPCRTDGRARGGRQVRQAHQPLAALAAELPAFLSVHETLPASHYKVTFSSAPDECNHEPGTWMCCTCAQAAWPVAEVSSLIGSCLRQSSDRAVAPSSIEGSIFQKSFFWACNSACMHVHKIWLQYPRCSSNEVHAVNHGLSMLWTAVNILTGVHSTVMWCPCAV